MWTSVYAPPSADEAVEHLELLITDMAIDKTSPWFMQTVRGADLIALFNEEARQGVIGDHRTLQMPNILCMI